MAVFVELVEVLALSSMVLLLLLNQALHVVNFLDIDDGDHNAPPLCCCYCSSYPDALGVYSRWGGFGVLGEA
jgi:hypothetical protein